ncbi:MAG: hypothetical protein KIT73_17840, partial [Burkholderiales bacterium]|nr:hypothetical protein [Burkholderiales bacterium]
ERVAIGLNFLVPDYSSMTVTASNSVDYARVTGDYLSTDPSLAGVDYHYDYSRNQTGPYKWKADYTDEWCVGLCDAALYKERDTTSYWRTIVYEYFHHSIAADKNIGIEFTGHDIGNLSVQSAGTLVLGDQVRNLTGSTTLHGGTGITGSADAVVIANGLTLNGGNGGIAAGNEALAIDLVGGGALDATAAGTIRLRQVSGDLNVLRAWSSGADVELRADGSIVGVGSGTHVQGRSIGLSADYGNLGGASTLLRVDTDATADGTLTAYAGDHLHIEEVTGDLRIVTATAQGGNAEVRVANGRMIDANDQQVRDTRAESALLAIWDSMHLVGNPDAPEANAQETITAFEQLREREYRTYWQVRNSQPDPSAYDPGFAVQISADERSYLQNQLLWTDAQVDALATQRTETYHGLHDTVGALTGTFDAAFQYTATAAERASLADGAAWTESQLRNSFSAGLLKEASDTETRIEAPNVTGHDVTLFASGGIGSTAAPVTIGAGLGYADLNNDQKLALAAAERNDVTVDVDGTIHLAQRDDVDIAATGVVDASSGAELYVGSEGSLTLARIEAVDEIRIKVAGTLSVAPGATGPIVSGNDTVLEAADGSIGTALLPMTIGLQSGARLTARTGQDAWLHSADTVRVDTIYARHLLNLSSLQSLLAGVPGTELDLRAGRIVLNAGGAIGDVANPLDLGHDADGDLQAEAGDAVHLRSLERALTVAKARANGDLVLEAGHAGMVLVDPVQAGGNARLVGIGDIRRADTLAGTVIVARNLDITSTAGSIGAAGDRLRVDSDGTVNLSAADGVHLHEAVGDLIIGTATGALVDLRADDVITIDHLGFADADLRTLNAGGAITVRDALATASSLTVRADTIDLQNVIQQGAGGVLRFDLAGFGDGLAQSIDVNAAAPSTIRFDLLRANSATVAGQVADLLFMETLIGRQATFANQFYRVILDNETKTLFSGYDMQIRSDLPFHLYFQAARTFDTNAL